MHRVFDILITRLPLIAPCCSRTSRLRTSFSPEAAALLSSTPQPKRCCTHYCSLSTLCLHCSFLHGLNLSDCSHYYYLYCTYKQIVHILTILYNIQPLNPTLSTSPFYIIIRMLLFTVNKNVHTVRYSITYAVVLTYSIYTLILSFCTSGKMLTAFHWLCNCTLPNANRVESNLI